MRFLEWYAVPAHLLEKSKPDQIDSSSYSINRAVKACGEDLRIVVDSVYSASLAARAEEATLADKFSDKHQEVVIQYTFDSCLLFQFIFNALLLHRTRIHFPFVASFL